MSDVDLLERKERSILQQISSWSFSNSKWSDPKSENEHDRDHPRILPIVRITICTLVQCIESDIFRLIKNSMSWSSGNMSHAQPGFWMTQFSVDDDDNTLTNVFIFAELERKCRTINQRETRNGTVSESMSRRTERTFAVESIDAAVHEIPQCLH